MMLLFFSLSPQHSREATPLRCRHVLQNRLLRVLKNGRRANGARGEAEREEEALREEDRREVKSGKRHEKLLR